MVWALGLRVADWGVGLRDESVGLGWGLGTPQRAVLRWSSGF